MEDDVSAAGCSAIDNATIEEARSATYLVADQVVTKLGEKKT